MNDDAPVIPESFVVLAGHLVDGGFVPGIDFRPSGPDKMLLSAEAVAWIQRFAPGVELG